MFFKTHKVITDPQKISEILGRSIDTVYPSKEELVKELSSGKQLRIYCGIDPTATYVHLGHATNYLILKKLHALGHKIIVLVGDFTAMIGDPSDKKSLRKQLTSSNVKENLKTFKQQIGKILPFHDRGNPISFVFNSKWLSKLNFADLVKIASNFTVQQMIERDVFEKRIDEKKPLYVHEFFYPLMQGYDSVALEADVEIGGTDQTFNMLAGRTLAKNLKQKNKFVITTTLLEDPVTKEKLMSKSLGTGVGLNEPPKEMFGKIMALPDTALIQCFVDCTEKSLAEIELIKEGLKNGKNPRDVKIDLATEIVKMYHGKREAEKAKENFEQTFSKGEIPENVETITASNDELLMVSACKHGIASSNSEWRRLINQNAVEIMESKVKITDVDAKSLPGTYRVGKKRFFRIKNN